MKKKEDQLEGEEKKTATFVRSISLDLNSNVKHIIVHINNLYLIVLSFISQ